MIKIRSMSMLGTKQAGLIIIRMNPAASTIVSMTGKMNKNMSTNMNIIMAMTAVVDIVTGTARIMRRKKTVL